MLETPNVILLGSNLLFYIILYNIYRKTSKAPFKINTTVHKLGLFIILLFCVFAFWGRDWFHVYEFYDDLQLGARTHMEDIYVWVAQNLCPDYFTFRVVIWGTSLILFNKTLKYTKLPVHLCYFMFVVFGLLWFTYARVTLAMALMFYGVSLIYRKDNKKINILMGLTFIVISYFFHKTAIFGIGIILGCIVWQFLKGKASYIFLFVMISIMYIYMNTYASEIMMMDSTGDDNLSRYMMSAQSYLGGDEISRSLTFEILQWLEHFSYIAVSVLSIKLWMKQQNSIPSIILVFTRIVLLICVFSIIMSLQVSLNLQTFSERLFRFCFIPSVIIMSYLWVNNLYTKYTKIIVYVGSICSILSLMYSLYMV